MPNFSPYRSRITTTTSGGPKNPQAAPANGSMGRGALIGSRQPNMGNVKTDIQAGPIWGPERVNQSLQQFGNTSQTMPQGPVGGGMTGGQMAALQGQYGDNVQQGLDQGRSDLSRNFAAANAQHQLTSEMRRDAGAQGWAQQLARLYGTNLNTDLGQQRNALGMQGNAFAQQNNLLQLLAGLS